MDFEGRPSYLLPVVTRYLMTETTGVHSLERSAQEDTLLVLFNTAISNLVSTS